jgi:hypothetical protein
LLREKRSRLGLPDLRIVARRVRDRNPFYLAFITNLSWHRIGWLLAAGCWLLRRDYTIFVKGIIHRTNFNHKSAVGAMGSSPYRRGEPFNGERQTSCLRILGVPPKLHLQKTRHKPDKPDIAKRSATHPPLGGDRSRLARMWRDLENAESAKPVFDYHQSAGILSK